MDLGGVTSSRPRAAPARPGSRSESIPIPAARGSICILFLSPLRRPVAKIYWFRARFHCLFLGSGKRRSSQFPLAGGLNAAGPAQRSRGGPDAWE